jgi:hypothetical protein
MRSAYKVLVSKPEGKRQLARPSGRWAYNIKMNLKDMECEVVDRIQMTWIRIQWRTW